MLAKTMPGKITAFVCNNKKLCCDAWSCDKNTNRTMEDGPIPTSVEEYMEAIKRPERWMDGLLLASAAVPQKINLVVFQYKKGKWQKIAATGPPRVRVARKVPRVVSMHLVSCRRKSWRSRHWWKHMA